MNFTFIWACLDTTLWLKDTVTRCGFLDWQCCFAFNFWIDFRIQQSFLGSRYLMEISYDLLKIFYKRWAIFSLSASEILSLTLAVQNLTVADPCVSQTTLHLVCWCLYYIYGNPSFIHLHILSAWSLPFFWILWCSCWSPWWWRVL